MCKCCLPILFDFNELLLTQLSFPLITVDCNLLELFFSSRNLLLKLKQQTAIRCTFAIREDCLSFKLLCRLEDKSKQKRGRTVISLCLVRWFPNFTTINCIGLGGFFTASHRRQWKDVRERHYERLHRNRKRTTKWKSNEWHRATECWHLERTRFGNLCRRHRCRTSLHGTWHFLRVDSSQWIEFNYNNSASSEGYHRVILLLGWLHVDDIKAICIGDTETKKFSQVRSVFVFSLII